MRPLFTKRVLAAALCLSLAGTFLPGTASAVGKTESTSTASKTQLAFAAGLPAKSESGSITMKVAYADQSGVHQVDITPTDMTEHDVALLDSGSAFKAGATVELCLDGKGNVLNIKKVYESGLYFDTMKYGAELSPTGGKPGAMLANGWLTEKSGNKITVGDLDRFNETYTLASGVKVYEYNTDTGVMTQKTLADVPVTAKTDGEFYLTDHRQQVIAVFDRSYQDAANARVAELYYITPQPTIDAKYLYQSDHMPIDSFLTENDGKTVAKPTGAVWLTAVEPFAIIPDRLYYVGDNEVAMYLLKADDGKLILLDAGWPPSGYIYWQNIAEMGFDPRDVDYLLLTHGHGDHYGTAAEMDTMIKNAGGDCVIYECYEDMNGYDVYGFPQIPGIIKDAAVIDCVDEFYQHETWMEFEGFRLKSVLTPGHSIGTCSVIFEINDPVSGETLNMAYLGGYGVNGNTQYDPDNGKGYLRLAFQYGLRYLQQTVDPDYVLPQHTNQFPMLEIQKAAKEKGITFMEAMNRGGYEWVNFLEKRQAVITYEDYYQQWKADPTDDFGTEISLTDSKLQTIEAAGPYRREAGTYQITLADNGKLIQGFDRYMNKNEALRGVVSEAGNDVADGIFIMRDCYTHDPDAWYVQVAARVSDDYDGTCAGGPIEAVHKDWFEVIRTERLGSKAEAEAILASLRAGQTYAVTLDASSEIQLAADSAKTFQPNMGYVDVLSTAWYAGAVDFVTEQGLFKGASGGKFDPSGTMDRAMLATVLQRLAGGAVSGAAASFGDVADSAWYAGAVSWASSSGVMSGTSASKFSPNAHVTREQLAATLYRYAQLRGETAASGSLTAFPDASEVSAWAKDGMSWAVGAGVLTGTGSGMLAPRQSATRAEVAVVLQRFAQSQGVVIAKTLPKAEDMKIDLDDYYGQVIEGYYNFNCVVSDTVTRTAKFYIPAGTVYNQPTVFVGVPNGVDTWSFFVESGWKALADKEIFHVVLMEPENRTWGSAEEEIAYIGALNEDVSYRPFFCAFSSNFYGVAYGESADLLQTQSVNSPKSWAGIAVLGASGMTADALKALQAAPSKVPGVTLAQVQTPVWIASEQKTADIQRLVDFYKSANHSQPAKAGATYADEVYLPQKGGTVDDEWCANTVFDASDWKDCVNETYAQSIYTELFKGVYRYPGDSNGALRRPGDILDRGFEKFEAKVPGGFAADGSDLYNREWYVYVPDSVDTSKPAPLVFVFHGAGGSGNEIADRSGWAQVADEKGFIIVAPTGSHTLSVRNVSNMVTNELFRAMWNTGDATADRPSDLKFVEYLYDWMTEKYKVDASRVYVSGQSSGGMMTWACAARLPDLFAAAAPVSAYNSPEPLTDASLIPVLCFIGEKDTTFPGGFGNDTAKAAIQAWTKRSATVETYDRYTYMDGGKKCSSQEGLYTNYLYSTKAGVPMLRCVEVATKTHAILPSECFEAWDTLFAHFTKDTKTGTLYYDGKAVK